MATTDLLIIYPNWGSEVSHTRVIGGVILFAGMSRKAWLGLVGILLVALGGIADTGARAETWHALMQLTADSSSLCPKPPALLELTADGSAFRLTTAGGEDHTGVLAPDGTVDLRFTSSTTRAGSVIVTGNARTRDIKMVVPRGAGSASCAWALKPVDPAVAGRVVSWRATIQQIGGNAQRCNPGNRGRVQTSNLGLVANIDAIRNAPILMFPLKPDGSADIDTPSYYGSDKTARVKVEPGTGPRLVTFVTNTWVCAYRIVPD